MALSFFESLRELGIKPEGLVHVGANSGQEVPDYVQAGIKSAVLIEALDHPYRACAAKIARIPGYVAVKGLCTDIEGAEYDFHVASNEGASSSILTPKRHLLEHPEVRFSEKTLKLRSTTLDQVLDSVVERGFADRGKIRLLVMDTQGSELSVLKGSIQTLRHCDAIWTEVSRGGLYDGDVSFDTLTGFLAAFGFVLNNVAFNRRQYGDALYVRRQT